MEDLSPEEAFPCLAASYSIVKLIRSGSQGDVFLASKKNVNNLVACKSILEGVETASGEIRILKKLKGCPGVITLHEVIEEENSTACHLITDLCSLDLVGRVQRNGGGLSEKEAAFIVKSLARTLRSIHGLGILHRDIKVDNVLITQESPPYEVKLIDFGMSIDGFKKRTILGSVCGTEGCIAPEVLVNGEYSPASDMWGLGLVMYEILSGKRSFSNIKVNVEKRLKAQEDLPRLLNWHGVSVKAKELILGMLDMNPRKRFTTDQVLNHPWICRFDDEGLSSEPVKRRIKRNCDQVDGRLLEKKRIRRTGTTLLL